MKDSVQHFLVAEIASVACGGESERAAGRQVTGLSSTGSAKPGAATGSGRRPLMPVSWLPPAKVPAAQFPGAALPLCRVTRRSINPCGGLGSRRAAELAYIPMATFIGNKFGEEDHKKLVGCPLAGVCRKFVHQ